MRAALLALGCLLVVSRSAAADVAADRTGGDVAAAVATTGIAAGVIDARPRRVPADPAHAAASAALARRDELRLPVDPTLTHALVGDAPPDARQARAAAASAQVTQAYGELRCDDVAAASDTAALAWLAAAPLEVATAPLSRVLVLALLCADQRGDAAAFAAAGARLRALGHATAPAGVSAATWQRVPDVDATANAGLTLVTITASSPGAQVWVDLRPVGRAPAQVALGPGPHWVHAAASGGAVAAAAVIVDVQPQDRRLAVKLDLASEKEDKRWESLRDRVAAWRAGTPVDEKSLAEAMRDAGLVLIVLLVLDEQGQTRAELWRLAATAGTPTRLARVPATPAELDRAAAAALAPAKDAPLTKDAAAKDDAVWDKAWPYVALGALAVGLGVIWAVSTGDTAQRVEVRFP